MTYEEQILQRDLARTQEEIGKLTSSVKEMEIATERANVTLKDQYQEVLDKRREMLKEMVVEADSIKFKLIAEQHGQEEVEAEAKKRQEANPYAHVKRSQLDDETRAKIATEYGTDALLKMPL